MIGAGQSVGNYRILSKIGTGGMGAVYLAEHPLIGKRIALKVIHRELAGNKEVVQRFFQEARAVNKIGNEHIVEIHDFGVTPEGDHFYIMEYLEGKTLASVLSRETAMEVMRALHVGAQIASALAAAHASGVIHRDLKPDNIMLMHRLGDPDFVKVLDFGLAKMFAAAGASAVQTAVGVLLGTPQYMSPEACESKRDIDHRTDIYALGVLLFQMLTGVLPFDGETMGEVLVKQVTALPPAPRGLNPAIPPSVEQILLRCLAKHPDARFPTMMALRDALLDPEAYLRGSPPIAPARSVAPGEAVVDARQVLAAAEARTRMLEAAAPPPSAGGHTMIEGAHLAPILPPGPRSKQIPVPALAQPAEPKNNTMRIATPHGYQSRPPRKVWPVVLVVGLLLGLGGGAFAVAWFGRDRPSEGGGEGGAGAGDVTSIDAGTTTATGSGSATAASAGSGAGSGSAATGSGSGSAAPASSGSGSGSSGSGSGSATGGGSGSATGSGSGSASGSGSGSAATGSGGSGSSAVPAGERAKLTLDSRPSGATVYAPDGKSLGRTPLKLEWPISQAPVTFVLKLRGYRDKSEELTVTENMMSRVELERIPVTPPQRGSGAGRGSGKRPPGDGLIRPGD